MRNKFISDYIFQVTGKRRTPKQVGSRLQQLRDTAEGKRSAFSVRFPFNRIFRLMTFVITRRTYNRN